MLIPRFSLRWLLAVMTVSGVFFFVVAQAARGSQWAIAVTAAVGGFLLTMVVYALLFSIAWLLGRLIGVIRPRRVVPTSPFASAHPPPQYIPPEDPA